MESKQEPQIKESQLTSGRTIAKNTVFNLIGQVLPALIALAAIPLLVKGLGIEQFGILTLAWLVIGYFSLFDFGLGRAITHIVADLLGKNRQIEIPGYVWTALIMLLLLGIMGTLIVVIITPLLVERILKIPRDLQTETMIAFYLLALSIPMVINTAALRGVLEAQQRFDLVNLVRIPMGIFTYIGPLLILPFTNNLSFVVAVLVFGRLIAWLAYLILVFFTMPILRKFTLLKRSAILPLARFGGWMTISSIVGPLMIYLDRFLIGAFISAAAVAYYATPYEAATKLTLIPSALVGVLFPAFAVSYVQDRKRSIVLLERGVRLIFLILFPITLVIVVLANEGMSLWLGQTFAQKSSLVLKLLVIGVLMNNLASVPYTFVQGVGRPDIAAKLHLFELPLYLLLLWQLLPIYGIVGAAIAWTLRTTLDMIILYILTFRLIRLDVVLVRRTALMIGIGMVVLLIALFPFDLNIKVVLLIIGLITFSIITWLMLLLPYERVLAITWIKKLQKIS